MQQNPLSEKVALVTGSARRIGSEIIRTLYKSGMRVVIHYHTSEEPALSLCEELNQQRERSAIALTADLGTAKSAKVLIEQAVSTWGRLDALVNNASRFYRTLIGEVNEQMWDDLINSNLKAPFFLSQAAAPSLALTKGTIINVTDIHTERPMRDYAVYCVSKSGLAMLTKVLAKELGPDIRVNGVAPGAIAWPEGENSLSDEDKQKIIERTLLEKGGMPEDIAKAVLFFVRDADYITGQILMVDGGRSLSGS